MGPGAEAVSISWERTFGALQLETSPRAWPVDSVGSVYVTGERYSF